MDFDKFNLTDEQKAKIKNCKNADEILELAKAEGVELTPDQLDAVAGGGCGSFWDTVNGGCDYKGLSGD